MSKTKALKPCPFCGAKPGTLARPDNIDGTEFYAAVFCHCDGYSATAHAGCRRKTQDEATSAAHAAWNHRAALAAQQAPEPSAPTIAAWAMQIPGCDGSADWVELGPDKPAPVDGVVARALVWADEAGQSAQQAPAAQPVTDAVPLSGKWEGAEEWMPLAWELCAEECGEEACTELVWEGGPIPEPWGDRWLKYEGEAKRLIALVRKCTAGAAPGAQQAEPQPVSDSSFEGWFSTYSPAGKGDEQRARDAYAAGLSDAAAHPQQPAPQPLTVTRIDPGFRWDGKSQHHVPNLLIEFEPVPANGPSDAKGWRDRDALAATLDGIGTATTVPTTDKEQQQ
jgi:Lar family restriction alleviation protein